MALAFSLILMGGGGAFAQISNPANANTASPQMAQDPGWQALKPSQKKALAPLAPHWSQISVAQKNKWLANHLFF